MKKLGRNIVIGYMVCFIVGFTGTAILINVGVNPIIAVFSPCLALLVILPVLWRSIG